MVELLSSPPDQQATPGSTVNVADYEHLWKTPGLVLAVEVSKLPDVRMVLERPDPDRFLIFVILDQDPDGTLDAIFSVEEHLYRRFPRMPFDVRVMKPEPGWDSTALERSTVTRLKRR